MKIIVFFISMACLLFTGCFEDNAVSSDNSVDTLYISSPTGQNPEGPLEVVWSSINNGESGENARYRLKTTLSLGDAGFGGISTVNLQFNNPIDWLSSQNAFDIQKNGVSIVGQPGTFMLVMLGTNNSILFQLTNFDGYISQLRDADHIIGAVFSVIVNLNLRDIYGNALEQPYQLSFIPEPHFRAYPHYLIQDSYAKEHDSLVIVSGSRPDIDFSSALDSASFMKNLVLRAEDSLIVETLGNIAHFDEIDDDLRDNYEYVIKIEPDLVDKWGNRLIHGYEFRFTTAPK